MNIYDATLDKSGREIGSRWNQIHEPTLWSGFEWDSADPKGSRARRNVMPLDDNIRKAIARAEANVPHAIYLDDAHSLSKPDTLLLLSLIHDYKSPESSVVAYGQPVGGLRFARNLFAESDKKYREGLWVDSWERIAVRELDGMFNGSNDLLDFVCPTIYLQSGIEDHTKLSAVQAWQVSACEVIAATRYLYPGEDVVAFIGILDPEHNTPQVAERMAECVNRWNVDVVLWGKNQKPLADALQEVNK